MVARAGLVANSTVSVPRPGPAARGQWHRCVRKVQSAVNQRVPTRGSIGQVDRDPTVLRPPRGSRVLALHANSFNSLFQVTGLIDHQHCIRVGEVSDDIGPDIVAHPGQPSHLARDSKCCRRSGEE